MITRIWHGITKAENADAYLKYVEATGIKDYRDVKGNFLHNKAKSDQKIGSLTP